MVTDCVQWAIISSHIDRRPAYWIEWQISWWNFTSTFSTWVISHWLSFCHFFFCHLSFVSQMCQTWLTPNLWPSNIVICGWFPGKILYISSCYMCLMVTSRVEERARGRVLLLHCRYIYYLNNENMIRSIWMSLCRSPTTWTGLWGTWQTWRSRWQLWRRSTASWAQSPRTTRDLWVTEFLLSGLESCWQTRSNFAKLVKLLCFDIFIMTPIRRREEPHLWCSFIHSFDISNSKTGPKRWKVSHCCIPPFLNLFFLTYLLKSQ